MNLVIVESPAKGKTIEKYLGKDYKVLASFGHIRDLPKGTLGVDTEHDFEPKYVIPPKARKTIKALKEAMKKADKVYLATDYDREGEAIAYHINEVINPKNPERITFTEITKEAITDAVKQPRTIDMHLVDAQQARRVLDRLVGYKLSPFLWKKVFKGLSAGRVQSVAVRLIVEREREITAFKPEEYWSIGARLSKNGEEFIADLKTVDGTRIEKLDIKNKKEADAITTDLKSGSYEVITVTKENQNKYPYPPFTTSTLQQEAAKRLHFSAKQTMKLAQDLYEAGKITYMRTDSVNLSQSALSAARDQIMGEFGKENLPEIARIYKTKSKGAQEAHEAVRPSHIEIKPEELDGKFDEKHQKLYALIRNRMLACQMVPAILELNKVEIKTGKYVLRANGTKIAIQGFMKAWPTKLEEKSLPDMQEKDQLKLIETLSNQHFTEPPARYSEASLIKTLEEFGIGRPSTYAPIISTIQDRGYVRKEQGRFYPNDTANMVTDLLVKNFPDIVDVKFTAQMEEEFDDIAENKLKYAQMLKNFYSPFEKNLEEKLETVEKLVTHEETNEKCDKCGKPMIIKMGRFGKFMACSGFPDCKNTKQIINKTGIKCPECGKGDVIERKTRRGKTFWGCERYPECKWASWNDPRKLKVENEKLKVDNNKEEN